jgi:hypothetical protein
MATNFTVLYDDVMPVIPGAPLVLAQQEIRAAAIEFFARSLTHQAAMTPVASVIGQADYTIVNPIANTVIEQVLEVTYNGGAPLRFARRVRDLVSAYGPTWSTLSAVAPDYVLVNPQCTSVKLIKKPSTVIAGAIAIYAVLKPTHAATSISDDDLYQQHRLVISEGAKARLFAMPKKPWTNLELANRCLALFNDGVEAARVRTMAGQGQNTGLARSAQRAAKE